MKYKKGQKVRIKSVEVLDREENYNDYPGMNSAMFKYADTIQEIEDYESSEVVTLVNVYRFDDDDWGWLWHEDWLEPVSILEIDTDALGGLLDV